MSPSRREIAQAYNFFAQWMLTSRALRFVPARHDAARAVPAGGRRWACGGGGGRRPPASVAFGIFEDPFRLDHDRVTVPALGDGVPQKPRDHSVAEPGNLGSATQLAIGANGDLIAQPQIAELH